VRLKFSLENKIEMWYHTRRKIKERQNCNYQDPQINW